MKAFPINACVLFEKLLLILLYTEEYLTRIRVEMYMLNNLIVYIAVISNYLF